MGLVTEHLFRALKRMWFYLLFWNVKPEGWRSIGWHQQDGSPIQPLYIGHDSGWVDYSHGIRLISRRVLVDGVENDLRDVLEHPAMWPLVSDEGVMRDGRYPTATR